MGIFEAPNTMQTCDVLIVGGGPAGSTAAWKLIRGGAKVIVLDKQRFPRLKLCAGWITPGVVNDLQLDVQSYPHRLLHFRRIHFHWKGLRLPVSGVQHSIRRVEFDAWLLERSRAPVIHHNVRNIRVQPDGSFVVDGAFRCRYLIGAGGTPCPVYRSLFREVNPRVADLQAVTLEHEIEYEWRDPDCHLWFFDRGLPGYSWYVPKRDGWLNVGLGGFACQVKDSGRDIREHWAHLESVLGRKLAPRAKYDPRGYSYYMRTRADNFQQGNAFIVGDSAGLATRDMAEGIGPAVRSALLAARAILENQPYRLDNVPVGSLTDIIDQTPIPGFVKRGLGWAASRVVQ